MTPEHADESNGYLKTYGRATGAPHEIEIWFAVDAGVIYLLSGSGGQSDWCLNLDHNASAEFTIDGTVYPVVGRRVTKKSEDQRARRAVFDKYTSRYGGDLVEWREASAPFALDPAEVVR